MTITSKTKKPTLNKTVYVGMSGGVDSSVSAALLLQQGYVVTGVFIKVWQPDFMPCSWKEERRDAMRVCAHLNIPFVTLDLEKEYKKEVVDYMIDEYKKGRTPNPDVMCNKYVKFGGFFDWAMMQGADYVATGHYAKIIKVKPLVYQLLKGNDASKDQSYFLWTMTQKQLRGTLFPVGNFEKPEVRTLAKKFKLPNAEKRDSQGLCFVGKVDMKEFLGHYIPQKTGNVLNTKNEIIGTHSGALFYTLGERHGFEITKKTPADLAYFVVGKDIRANTITVDHKVRYKKVKPLARLRLINANWITGEPKTKLIYEAKIRYRGDLLKIKVKPLGNNKAELEFLDTDEVVAPGQSVVIYEKRVCIGGGIVA